MRRFDVTDGRHAGRRGGVRHLRRRRPSTAYGWTTTGRVWVAAHDGLHCFDPDGTLLGKLHLPEVVANLTFGGPKRNQLYICASSSLFSLRVNVNGVRYPG